MSSSFEETQKLLADNVKSYLENISSVKKIYSKYRQETELLELCTEQYENTDKCSDWFLYQYHKLLHHCGSYQAAYKVGLELLIKGVAINYEFLLARLSREAQYLCNDTWKYFIECALKMFKDRPPLIAIYIQQWNRLCIKNNDLDSLKFNKLYEDLDRKYSIFQFDLFQDTLIRNGVTAESYSHFWHNKGNKFLLEEEYSIAFKYYAHELNLLIKKIRKPQLIAHCLLRMAYCHMGRKLKSEVSLHDSSLFANRINMILLCAKNLFDLYPDNYRQRHYIHLNNFRIDYKLKHLDWKEDPNLLEAINEIEMLIKKNYQQISPDYERGRRGLKHREKNLIEAINRNY